VAGPVVQLEAGTRTAHVSVTSVADGDLAVTGKQPDLDARRRAVVDLPWTWMRQVHGATVVRVQAPGDGAGSEADAAVTGVPGAVLAVHVADCAPVAFAGAEGVIGIAHVGWRGLVRGTIAATVDMMGGHGVRAVLGPCIHAECYEFGAADLDVVAEAAGAGVRSRTMTGAPALDLVAGVEEQVKRCGVELVPSPWQACTAHTPGYWSHRARGDRERQAMVIWMSEP
jgi:YfiH family protein